MRRSGSDLEPRPFIAADDSHASGERADRVWAGLFALLLGAVLVTSALAFPRLQAEATGREIDASGKSIRAAGFRLARRPDTSLIGLVAGGGPSADMAGLTFGKRRGFYLIQSWLSGHEAVGPAGPYLDERGWRQIGLVPLRIEPDAPQLRPRAGLRLAPLVVREVDTASFVYGFLFDPDAPDALAPDETVLLLPDPVRKWRVFVTSDSRLHEIEQLLR